MSWTVNIHTWRGRVVKRQEFHTKCGMSESIFFPLCARCKYYMQPCLVVWGCAWVSLMFCLEPDWAWPDCTALKQLEGFSAVWEPSQGAGGVPVIYGRMDSEGRREVRREKALFSLKWDKHGQLEKDEVSDTLDSYTHLHTTPNKHTSPFIVSFNLHKNKHTCA